MDGDTPVRGALLDLSGVLYQGDRALPGASDALVRLRSAGLPIRFVTNVTRTPADALLRKLTGMGLDVRPAELVTAPRAAREHLTKHALSPLLLIHPSLHEEFRDLETADPDAVLLGDAGEDFTYANLNRAFRLLLSGAPLLAMGNNRYFRDEDGLSLDIGPFVAALEYASDCKAIVLGKPSAAFFHAAVETLGIEPAAAVMVGDDALADVAGALSAGLRGVLVRTGKYRSGDEDRIPHPGAMVEPDIAGAVDWILRR